MAASSPADGEVLRGSLLRIDASRVLAAVDSLQLKGHARVTPVVGFPLRTLQQKRDVTAFATTAPLAAVSALVELLAAEPLEKVVETLGDHAESPTYDQLASALDALVSGGLSDDEVVAVLAYAIAEGFPAAPHCRRLLEERPAWTLPHVDVAPPTSVLAPRETDEAQRARRRARRAERKKAPSSPPRPVHRPRGPKSSDAVRVRVPEATAVTEPATTVRRRLTLTPAEVARFDPDHPLVGTVVLVDLPFEALDPTQPEARSKERPCLVVAASRDGVLVRGVFSSPAATRSLFEPWRRVGLDHPSYLDDARVALSVDDATSLVRLGRLSDAEWNATF